MEKIFSKEEIRKQAHVTRYRVIGISVLSLSLILIIANIINVISKSADQNFQLAGSIIVVVILIALLSPFIYFAGIKLLVISARITKAIATDSYEVVEDSITGFLGSHEVGTSDNWSTNYSYSLRDYTKRTKEGLTLPLGLHKGDKIILVYYKGTNELITFWHEEESK